MFLLTRRITFVAAVAITGVVLAGCTTETQKANNSPTSVGSLPVSATTDTPGASASAADAALVAKVTVTGAAGSKPSISMPATPPPTTLQVRVLSAGSGPVVKSGDTLSVNYLGQIWKSTGGGGEVFDNSFDRGQPYVTSIGNGSVIDGWDHGIVGQKYGSRLLIVAPPNWAYGKSTPDSPTYDMHDKTLVFVAEVNQAQ